VEMRRSHHLALDSHSYQNSGEQVVYGFSLFSNSNDAVFNFLKLKISWESEDVGAIKGIRLYLDEDDSGSLKSLDLLSVGSYDSSTGAIEFELSNPVKLETGEKYFLVSIEL